MSSGIPGDQESRIPVFQVVQASLNQKMTLKQELERDEGTHSVGIWGGSFLPDEQLVQSLAVQQGNVGRKMRGPGWPQQSEEGLGGDFSTQEAETGLNGNWTLARKSQTKRAGKTQCLSTDKTCSIHI